MLNLDVLNNRYRTQVYVERWYRIDRNEYGRPRSVRPISIALPLPELRAEKEGLRISTGRKRRDRDIIFLSKKPAYATAEHV